MRQVRRITQHMVTGGASAGGGGGGGGHVLLHPAGPAAAATIVLNRPDKLNSITDGMVADLAAAYAKVRPGLSLPFRRPFTAFAWGFTAL